jgi:hypothetical protein
VQDSTAASERVLEAARDFTDRRAELWRDYLEHMTIHDRGEKWADVTEGNRWPIGLVWERLRYDWSEPDVLKGTVVESNIFKAGSTWEIRATRADEGGSRVEVIGVRHLRGRGWLLWPFFPLGLARRDVSAYLRQFLAKVEAGQGCRQCHADGQQRGRDHDDERGDRPDEDGVGDDRCGGAAAHGARR